MGKVYQKTMANNPEAFFESFSAANRKLYSDSKALLFGSFLTFHGELSLKPLMNFEDSLVSHIAIALQKDSEFKEMFDFHLLSLFESGILNALER
jgi:hypothetical protein